MHNELERLLDLERYVLLPDAVSFYTVAYRPLRRDEANVIDIWPMPLTVGQELPTVPLSLAADFCLAVDLEEAYRAVCRRRVDEAVA